MTDDVDPSDAGSPAAADRERVARRLRRAAMVAAAVAVVVLYLGDRLGWFDYRPGGTAFSTYVQPAALVLLAAGAVVALRWEIAGAMVGGFAAGAIGAFAVHQLIAWHAVWVIALIVLPAVLWLVADTVDWHPRHIALGLAAALLATGGGVVAGHALYDSFYGPTHPPSTRAALPESAVRWVWSGGVTSTSAELRTRTERDDVASLRLAVTDEPGDGFGEAVFVDSTARDGTLGSFHVDGLRPDTTYRYAVETDGELDIVRAGTFTTFPTGPASFRFTVGGCARTGSNGSVFDAIADEAPLFHLIAGDFHYGDIPDDDRARYDEVIDLTLRQPAQAHLYRSVPIAYVWDDHDYGVNDSDALSPSRVAAMEAYRANVPSYELRGALSPIFQTFDVGRVRFVLTDARSAREPGERLLGDEQLGWLLDELERAADDEAALVVWLNPVPWVAEASPGSDDWGGYPDERALIADTIAELGLDLLMVSGDAHMVAIDDGSNTDFSTGEGDAGFPLLHAAALDRPGSVKGGPYSEGAIGGGGQYGLVDVVDDGDTISVSLRAKRYDGEVLLAHDFRVDG